MTVKKRAANRKVAENLRQFFDLLFSEKGQLYGLETRGSKDRFANAITGDLETDLWRSWRAAKPLMANSKPLEATERFRKSQVFFH